MNINHERTQFPTDEWYTPREIFEPLGKFNLDPCTPMIRLWDTANNHYTKEDNGLIQEWFGRVWLNPPYSQPLITQFMEKMAVHNNGIALLFNRCDTKMFQTVICPVADSIFFLQSRIHFYRPDGTQGNQPGAGSILISYGKQNTKAVLDSGLRGTMFKCVRSPEAIIQTKLF